MNQFKELQVKEFQYNPFDLIGNEWMFISAVKEGKVNTLTASWGGFGVMWNRNVVFVFIRQSRFTKEFVDAADSFSLTFFDTEKYREIMTQLGTESGRKESKMQKAGITVEQVDGVPYFKEAKLVVICRKMSRHHLSSEGFIDETVEPQWYADKDYHEMYIGEVVKIFEKENE
ncbi:MAG: flavin reductase [Anaerotignum sp.]|nr:flavin reductase [Anaerotignum sp.]